MTVLERSTLSSLLDPAYATDRLIAAGMSAQEAAAKGERFARCAKTLIDSNCSASSPVSAVFVPGRIEVLGKHTDYCGGRSLLYTVERGMCFVAVPRKDPTITFFALDLKEQARMALDPQLVPVLQHWANYPMTVARRVARNFPRARTGADIAMSSDLPAASGLSSSSAMVVGCFMILSRLNKIGEMFAYRSEVRSREALAGYCGCIENGQSFGKLKGDRGVGTHGGSQDHTAILCCKPNELSVFSFCPIRRERDIAMPNELEFVIVNSGVIAEKTKGAQEKYNRVSERARRIVELWNQKTGSEFRYLREVIGDQPAPSTELLTLLEADDRSGQQLKLVSRLQQFLLEYCEFIPAAVAAIETKDWKALGQVVTQSRSHAEADLENQTVETMSLSLQLDGAGAIAASPFGAGFGGSVWALASREGETSERMLERFSASEAFRSRPGCAALEL